MKRIFEKFSKSILGFVMFGTSVVWLFIWIAVEYIPSSDKLSWAQVVIELVLVPLVLFGFYQTRKEIRESQEKPELELRWKLKKIKDGETIDIPWIRGMHQNDDVSEKLMVKNAGERIARFYRIILIYQEGMHGSNIEKWVHNNSLIRSTFTCSDDEDVVFPDGHLRLGPLTWNFRSDQNHYLVMYEIYCDGAKLKAGYFNIALVEQDQGEVVVKR